MFFASFHFSILRITITINCNYLFTKHFNYKALIYLCQRPPPKNLLFFICTRGGWGKVVMWLCGYASGGCVGLAQGGFGETALNTKRLYSLGIFVVCRGICMTGIFAIADAFWDAAASA